MNNLENILMKCIKITANKFINDPFKYFAERDLHFELQEQLKETYPNGPYYIHPEYPVLVENYEFGKGKMKPRKTASIDMVITKLNDDLYEKPLIGIEMLLGKFNDGGLINIGPRSYYLTKSNLTDTEALEHLKGDWWKLSRTTPDNYYLLYFLTHVFTRDTEGRRRERIERISRITNTLRSYSAIDQKRLIIVEVIYERGMRTSREELGLGEMEV